MQAAEHPIQYTSDYRKLYYIQNMNNSLLHLISSYRIPKTQDRIFLTFPKHERLYCILPWPAPNSFFVHEMQLDFSELWRGKTFSEWIRMMEVLSLHNPSGQLSQQTHRSNCFLHLPTHWGTSPAGTKQWELPYSVWQHGDTGTDLKFLRATGESNTGTLLVKLTTTLKVESKNMIQNQPLKKCLLQASTDSKISRTLMGRKHSETLKRYIKWLEGWGTMLMNCKSPLLSFNVKGSCKSFLNLHQCFVHMQGLAANPAGPQDTYIAPCKRNYREKRNTWREKYICLLTENHNLRN